MVKTQLRSNKPRRKRTYINKKKRTQTRKQKRTIKKRATLKKLVPCQKGGSGFIINFTDLNNLFIIFQDKTGVYLKIDEVNKKVSEYLFKIDDQFLPKDTHLFLEKLEFKYSIQPSNTYESENIDDLIRKYWIFETGLDQKDQIYCLGARYKQIKYCLTGCFIQQMIRDITSYHVCALISFGVRIYKIFKESKMIIKPRTLSFEWDILMDGLNLPNVPDMPLPHSYKENDFNDQNQLTDYKLEPDENKVIVKKRTIQINKDGIDPFRFIRKILTNFEEVKPIKLSDNVKMSYMSQKTSSSTNKKYYTSNGVVQPGFNNNIQVIIENNEELVATFEYYYKNYMNAVLLKPLSQITTIGNISDVYKEISVPKEQILFISSGYQEHQWFDVCYCYLDGIVYLIKNYLLKAKSYKDYNQSPNRQILYSPLGKTDLEAYQTRYELKENMRELIDKLFKELKEQYNQNTSPQYLYNHSEIFQIDKNYSNEFKIFMYLVELAKHFEDLSCPVSLNLTYIHPTEELNTLIESPKKVSCDLICISDIEICKSDPSQCKNLLKDGKSCLKCEDKVILIETAELELLDVKSKQQSPINKIKIGDITDIKISSASDYPVEKLLIVITIIEKEKEHKFEKILDQTNDQYIEEVYSFILFVTYIIRSITTTSSSNQYIEEIIPE